MDKKLLEIRAKLKAMKPKFTMQDNHKKAKLGDKWKRPRGIDSKMRLNLRGYKGSPSKGYRSPAEVRGLSKRGLRQVLAYNTADLEKLNPKEDGIIIANSTGTKKRIEIIKKALDMNITIINIRNPQEAVKKKEEEMAKNKEEKKAKESEKEAKKKEKEKKAAEKEKKEKEGKGAKDELSAKLEDEEKKKQEKKELDKNLIHSN